MSACSAWSTARAHRRAFAFQEEKLSLLVWRLRNHLLSLWIFLLGKPSSLEMNVDTPK